MCFFRLEINIYILRRWVGFEVDTRVDTSMFPGRVGVAPTAAWDCPGAKSGKRDNCLFCSATPLHAQFPALPGLPCHFLSARYTAFLQRITLLPFIFGVHHLIRFSVWSPKIKSNYYKQFKNGIISREENNTLKNLLNK